MNKWFDSRAMMIATFALILLAILFLLFSMSSYMRPIISFLSKILGPFVLAMVLSYILNPVVNLLSSYGCSRSMVVISIYSLFLVSMVILIVNVLPTINEQLDDMLQQLPQLEAEVRNVLQQYNTHGKHMFPESIQLGIERLFQNIEYGVTSAIGNLSDGIDETLDILFLLLITPFLAFYMMRDSKSIEYSMIAAFPKARQSKILLAIKDIDLALGNYVRSQLIVCFIVGVLSYIGYKVIDLPSAFLLAFAVAIFNVIPYLGPILGAVPAMLVAATISYKKVVFVLVLNLIIQMIEGNIISPQTVGKRLHMHPLLIIFAVLVGGEAAGIWGLMLAVPILAVLKVITEHIILNFVPKT